VDTFYTLHQIGCRHCRGFVVTDKTNAAIQLKISQHPHLNQEYPKVSPPDTSKSLIIAFILRAWKASGKCIRYLFTFIAGIFRKLRR
jgi:hypothetical protein